MKAPLFLTSSFTALLISGASLTAQWTESFSDTSLDSSAWQEMQALGDNYSISWVDSEHEVGGGQLTVNDVVPTASGNYTADLIFRRDVAGLDDFQAKFDFGWDMTSSVEDTLVENRKAVPRILLRLLDADLNSVVEVGFEDQGYSGGGSTGFLVGDLNVPKFAGHGYAHKVGNADIIGVSDFQIVREAGEIFIFQDGGENAVVSGTNLASIVHAELVFGRRHFNALSDEFFGQAFVNEVTVIPEPSTLAYLLGLGGLFVFARRHYRPSQR